MTNSWKEDMYKGYRVVWSQGPSLSIPSWCLYTLEQTPGDSMCADWSFYKGGFEKLRDAHKWIDEQVKKKTAEFSRHMPCERTDLICKQYPMKLQTGKHGLFYGCTNHPKCNGSHGACEDGSPKGIPAKAETRQWRQKAIAAVDILANHLPKANIKDCQAIIELAKKFRF